MNTVCCSYLFLLHCYPGPTSETNLMIKKHVDNKFKKKLIRSQIPLDAQVPLKLTSYNTTLLFFSAETPVLYLFIFCSDMDSVESADAQKVST